jgi:restriction endonuclease S subunit
METLIGEVPDEWKQIPLGEVCDVLAGPSGAAYRGAVGLFPGVHMVTPKDIKDGRIVTDGVMSVEPAAAEKLSRYRLAPGDVLCERTGELGRHALVNKQHADWLFGTACLRLRPHQSISGRYLNHYLSHPAVRDWISRNAVGSAIPSLNTRTLSALPLVVPPRTAQAAIGDILGVLDEKIAIHDQISRTSAALRDSLLPLLVTGSILPSAADVGAG